LKRLGVSPIPGIEEVNMFKDDGNVIHFNNPKVSASPNSNTYVISGHSETKKITDVPGAMNQLLSDLGNLGNLGNLAGGEEFKKKMAEANLNLPTGTAEKEDDEIPALVQNFEDTANKEQ